METTYKQNSSASELRSYKLVSQPSTRQTLFKIISKYPSDGQAQVCTLMMHLY